MTARVPGGADRPPVRALRGRAGAAAARRRCSWRGASRASREKAARLILAGAVRVDGRRVDKAGALVARRTRRVEVDGGPRFVSRGGDKLAGALDAFGIDPAADGSASTWAPPRAASPTACSSGARHASTRWTWATASSTPDSAPTARVVVMERVNARGPAADVLVPRPTLATVDVSFISLEKVLPAVLGAAAAGRRGRRPRQAAVRGGAGAGGQGRGRPERRPAPGRARASGARRRPHAGWHVRGVAALAAAGTQGQPRVLPAAEPDRAHGGRPLARGSRGSTEEPRHEADRHRRQDRPAARRARCCPRLLEWCAERRARGGAREGDGGLVVRRRGGGGRPSPSSPRTSTCCWCSAETARCCRWRGSSATSTCRSSGSTWAGSGSSPPSPPRRCIPALEALLRGELVVDERMMLAARVTRQGERLTEYVALNDVVITKSAMSRIIKLDVVGRRPVRHRVPGRRSHHLDARRVPPPTASPRAAPSCSRPWMRSSSRPSARTP